MTGIAALGIAAYRSMPPFFRRMLADNDRDILPTPHVPNPAAWPDRGIHAAWIGHTTVLMKIDGYTILTDPVFSDKCGLDLLVATLGPKRYQFPALEIDKLPPVDLILLSHAHMDHLDVPSMKKLESNTREVVMARATSDLIRPRKFARVQEAGWGETVKAGPLELRTLEVKHWGARMRTDTYRGYNGYIIESGNRRILFAGDTASTDLFARQRHPKGVDLAIMPIGSYDPWIAAHCNPEQAWRMAQDAGAGIILPVHHKTFKLSYEPMDQPIARLKEVAGQEASRIAWTDIGQEYSLS